MVLVSRSEERTIDISRQCGILGHVVCCVLALSADPAKAAESEQAFRDLEARTRLDLSKTWARYVQQSTRRPFAECVDAELRRRRDVGRGLVFGGAGVALIATTVFSLALPRTDAESGLITSYVMYGAAGGMMIVGGILWSRNFRKLERLEAATLALGPRGRVRLAVAGPQILPRGAGFGVALAF